MDKQQAIKKLTLAWIEYQVVDKQSNLGLVSHNEWTAAHSKYRGYRFGLLDAEAITWEDIGEVEMYQLTIAKPV